MTQELTSQELDAEGATALPNKEVMSLLDLNAQVDLGLDLAAPVDLAAAANLNVAAPIEASAAANVLSPGADAGSEASQHGVLVQGISGTADATAPQHAAVDQTGTGATDGTGTTTDGTASGGTAAGSGDPGTAVAQPTGDPSSEPVATPGPAAVTSTPSAGDVLNGASLLDANVNIDAQANLAAPIDGAVAANANVAAPVDAAVAANLISPDAHATALAPQDIAIEQELQDVNASATATQDASVTQ
ncbi:MAG TPA: peptidoglycan-binding protein [Mycobacteriales bacterium]|nr:peptidoglycan-binding protein [Mycobacteriales bacterium]